MSSKYAYLVIVQQKYDLSVVSPSLFSLANYVVTDMLYLTRSTYLANHVEIFKLTMNLTLRATFFMCYYLFIYFFVFNMWSRCHG